MQFGKRLDQVESNATSAVRLHFRTVHLIEAVKDMALILITDAFACISYLNLENIFGRAIDHQFLHYRQTDRYTTMIWRKLICIAQQIVDDFTQLIYIKLHEQLRYR